MDFDDNIDKYFEDNKEDKKKIKLCNVNGLISLHIFGHVNFEEDHMFNLIYEKKVEHLYINYEEFGDNDFIHILMEIFGNYIDKKIVNTINDFNYFRAEIKHYNLIYIRISKINKLTTESFEYINKISNYMVYIIIHINGLSKFSNYQNYINKINLGFYSELKIGNSLPDYIPPRINKEILDYRYKIIKEEFEKTFNKEEYKNYYIRQINDVKRENQELSEKINVMEINFLELSEKINIMEIKYLELTEKFINIEKENQELKIEKLTDFLSNKKNEYEKQLEDIIF